MNIEKQLSSAEFWTDEKGTKVPYSYVPKSRRLMEMKSYSLLKDAVKINETLAKFKENVIEVCNEVFQAFMKENESAAQRKGNFEWYNFDRSIKVSVNIAEKIEFDDLGILASKAEFDEYLNQDIESKDGFGKLMVLDAFETRKGKLDTKKVLSLLSWKSKNKNETFQKAMKLLEEATRRTYSKTYFQISARQEDGSYKVINLNFSSI